jgi:hypothetical protein
MKRMHVHVSVESIDHAIAFYSTLFGRLAALSGSRKKGRRVRVSAPIADELLRCAIGRDHGRSEQDQEQRSYDCLHDFVPPRDELVALPSRQGAAHLGQSYHE